MSNDTSANASANRESVVDQLSTCPVCFDNPMMPPLWTICKDNRHVICKTCFEKLKDDQDNQPPKCPQCRDPFIQVPMRNRMRPACLSDARHALSFALTYAACVRTAGLLEDQLAEKLGEFACPHKCGATYSYSGWPAHALVCTNAPIACPCWGNTDKLLSGLCSFRGTLAELGEHMPSHSHSVLPPISELDIKTFMQRVTEACNMPANHPYYADQLRDYDPLTHSTRLPIPASMLMIGDESWKIEEVYGLTYGYSVYLGGLCITFFLLRNNDSAGLHYTAYSVTSEKLRFDIVMTSERTQRMNYSTMVESCVKVSHRMVSRSPFAPLTDAMARVRACAGEPLRYRYATHIGLFATNRTD